MNEKGGFELLVTLPKDSTVFAPGKSLLVSNFQSVGYASNPDTKPPIPGITIPVSIQTKTLVFD